MTSIFLVTASSYAQEIRCVERCSVLEEEKAVREAGLEWGECDAAVKLEIAPVGSVADVVLTRQDENRICNDALVAFAHQTRWSPAPGESPRWKSIGWSKGQASLGTAEFHTYPGGLGLDSDQPFLLAHRDPRVDLTMLAERFSRLGPFETIEEFRSDAPILCAIGRDPSGDVVLHSTALDELAQHPADANPFDAAAGEWPDLELLGAHVHQTAGSCFLLRSTASSSSLQGSSKAVVYAGVGALIGFTGTYAIAGCYRAACLWGTAISGFLGYLIGSQDKPAGLES